MTYKLTELMHEIAEAAKQGNSEYVLRNGKQLQQVELCIQRYEEILLEVDRLTSNATGVKLGLQSSDSTSNLLDRLERANSAHSGREAGARIRRSFLEKLARLGQNLTPLRGTIYKTPMGMRVGIAVASARQENRWFLCLPDGGFDLAALLCETVEGDVIEVCLSRSFFSQHGHLLSKSNGQVKFNVYRRGKQYSIKVPTVGPIDASGFIGNYPAIT